MGSIYKISTLSPDKINKLMHPIVYCMDKSLVVNDKKEYNFLSLNLVLSEKLLRYPKDKRYIYAVEELNQIISNFECKPLLTDFEMLFDPGFQVDVLKLFILLNRKKHLAILWPGELEGELLKYAEPSYQDYKSYNIKNYDISCII